MPEYVGGDFEGAATGCGSSNECGQRVARWYQDALNKAGRSDSEAFLFAGCIRRWAEAQNELTEYVYCFPARN